jgi:hypothetical protein
MKRVMKRKIKEFFSNLQDKIDYGLRRVCYGLSPAERLITILIFCVGFGIMSIYITVSSIYNIGKQDAKKEFLEMQHIEQPKLPPPGNENTNLKNRQDNE